MRKAIDQGLRNVGDDRQATRHVAIERAIADADLGLVAGAQHQGAELIGKGHEHGAANARLQILFGHVFFVPGEGRLQRLPVGFEDIGNAQQLEANAEIGGQLAGIVNAAAR